MNKITYMLLYIKKDDKHLCLVRGFHHHDNVFSILDSYPYLYAATIQPTKTEATYQMNMINNDMEKRGQLLDILDYLATVDK